VKWNPLLRGSLPTALLQFLGGRSDYLREIDQTGEQLSEDILKETFDEATVKQIK